MVHRVAVLVGALAVACWSQQASTPGSPSFHSRADLVLVPVHVRDHGAHVAALTKEDFTLLQDGERQVIATFEEVRTKAANVSRPDVVPNEFTNEIVVPERAPRFTIIAIDKINTTAADMSRLRE